MNQSDLFSSEKEDSRPAAVPLAFRMSPRTLEEFAGQEEILGPGKLLRRLIESDRLASLIFYGPPGSGKSALARIIAKRTKAHFEETNAVIIGVGDIRKIVDQAVQRLRVSGRKTILLIDEIHHFNRTQQDALLPSVEKGIVSLIGITTENPYFYVNPALISRSILFEFRPLKEEMLIDILRHALRDRERGLGTYRVELAPEAERHLLTAAGGDARRLLNALEVGVLSTRPDEEGIVRFGLTVAVESVQKRSLHYDKSGDEHYDHVSAFIKSLRGSDPDAALFWMAKMLAAGEDPRFIARRVVIFASEDVGNADPQALAVAVSALQAVEFVGLPEAKINLAQAVTYAATAPKSNASYAGLRRAEEEVSAAPHRPVPLHLRDANLDAKGRGHGAGYKYPHDYPGHFVEQEYWPDPRTLYEPSDQGYEVTIAERLSQWRAKRGDARGRRP